jgi:hypothetical protein
VVTPGKSSLAFLQSHREVIVAVDLFTVPAVTFEMLYCLFVIEHGTGHKGRGMETSSHRSRDPSTRGESLVSGHGLRSGSPLRFGSAFLPVAGKSAMRGSRGNSLPVSTPVPGFRCSQGRRRTRVGYRRSCSSAYTISPITGEPDAAEC